jgi:hypothetical protein
VEEQNCSLPPTLVVHATQEAETRIVVEGQPMLIVRGTYLENTQHKKRTDGVVHVVQHLLSKTVFP